MAGFLVPMTAWLYQGQPAASGTVDVYQTMTTTHVTIYSDAAMANPIANPLTLDANGQAVFYVGSSVALRLDGKTSTGTLIRSIDPVFIEPDLSGITATATQLNYLTNSVPGTATASSALVLDASENIIGLATNTANTSSTGIANMAAVQNSMVGGFINRFRNGAMDIWQRGISGTITAGVPSYTADGWYVGCTGANVPWAQTAGRASTEFALKVTGAASVTDVLFKQRIESYVAAVLYPNAAARITVQAKIYNNTGGSITPTLTVKHATIIDNWGATVTDVSAVSLQACANGSLTTVAYTFNSASGTQNGLEVTIDCGNNFSSNAKSVEIGELDIRVTPGVAVGLNATPPVPELRPRPVEAQLCAWYLPAVNGNLNMFGDGQCVSATQAYLTLNYPLTRIASTAIVADAAAHFFLNNSAGGSIALTALAWQSASLTATVMLATVSAGLTAGNATKWGSNSVSSQLLITGIEL